MNVRKFYLPLTAFAGIVLAANLVSALGFGLSETKEQLKLQYDVVVKEHKTGRVTVDLTIADEGRLKPLDAVELFIPGKAGTGPMDLVVSLATHKVDGKLAVRAHLIRELAERAELRLITGNLDGKQDPFTSYYHSIPLAKYLKDEGQKKK